MPRRMVVEIFGDASSLERSFSKARGATAALDRDLGRASRGAISAAVSFRGMGRALAFGSAQFLGGAGLVFGLKSTITAAENSQRVIAQTRNAVEHAGLSWQKYGDRIRAAANAEASLSGFDDERLLGTFSTLLRVTGNVNRALTLNAVAANVARGKNISLESATAIVTKASIGMAGALRRVGIATPKTASGLQLVDLLARKFGGSAAAYGKTAAGSIDVFHVAVENLQEAIGSGLLPQITRTLTPLSQWLNDSRNQERVQRDVTEAVHDARNAFRDIAGLIHAADKVTGSFKHTLELLLGLKIAFWARGVDAGVAGIGTSAAVADGEVVTLRNSLVSLGGIAVAPIVIPIEIKMGHNLRDAITKHAGILGNAGKALLDIATAGGAITGGNIVSDLGGGVSKSLNFSFGGGVPIGGVNQTPIATDEAAAKAAAGRARTAAYAAAAAASATDANASANKAEASARRASAALRNTFFDNAIARILLRGGLGDIQQQIAALNKADALIQARIKVTKDVTRRLRLEDELLQNEAQIRGLKAQQAATALQNRQDAMQEFIATLQLGVTRAQATSAFTDDLAALRALEDGIRQEIKEFGRTAELRSQLFDVQQQIKQTKQSQLSASEFFTLGLGPTGDPRVPTKANLRKRFGTISEAVKGTFLDTAATRKTLAEVRKVLSESIVPTDVRSKIKEMFDAIRDELNKGLGTGNVTRSAHANTERILAGLGLSPALKRELDRRLAQIGVGGTIPSARSLSFAAAGASNPLIVHTTVNLDGKTVAKNTTQHQRRAAQRRSDSRRGPYAGRN